MSRLVETIVTDDAAIRDRSLDSLCAELDLAGLLDECAALDTLRRSSDNLYHRVRALFFLYAIHRFHVPRHAAAQRSAHIPADGYAHVLKRRYEEAIRIFLASQSADGPSAALSSALASAHRGLAFATLADQVRRSVRSVRGNQWMFRTGDPADYPLRIRSELLVQPAGEPLFPILAEATPVRMDLSHSGWSDIFFLGMDFPDGARVLNISVDLAVRGGANSAPKPPVEAYFRVIDQPVLRLVSVDLGASTEIATIAEVFDFARDYLGLLKAAVIAAGIVPPGMEGSSAPLASLLGRLTGRTGHGIEIVSSVNDIPKGSRLAVSTNLLACLITVIMRATSQIRALTGGVDEEDRRIVAARAILGEWLGGSGGGWQDSGGVWPGVKLIHGVAAEEGDPEFGVSRGCLLPRHHVFSDTEVPAETRRRLQDSLVLVHGGMAQDVGPILEMVTERYLLRSDSEWEGRKEAIAILDEAVACLRAGDVRAIGDCTQRNFDGPIQTIIPWAGNVYTETLTRGAREAFGADFWGFWMLGGMSGGGMGFLFAPHRKAEAQEKMQQIMDEARRRLETAAPFAMQPVVYEFAIDERGTWAALREGGAALMPPGYYALTVPSLLRAESRLLTHARRAELDRFTDACRTSPELAGMVQHLFDRLLPRAHEIDAAGVHSLERLLESYGFDRVQHEQIQSDLRAGRVGLAQNHLPATSRIEDAAVSDLGQPGEVDRDAGRRVLAGGEVAVVTLAGGSGTRWTRGAGVVKALNPFCRLGGKYRSFLEVHLAKSSATAREHGAEVPHVITTSYLTHDAIEAWLRENGDCRYEGPLLLSPGKTIGLRTIPMERDLRFAWEETAHQVLDEQAQKVRESLHSTLIAWARQMGEGSDYTDNVPAQCLHPVGHWYEIANLLLNGTLRSLIQLRPQLRHLMIHNIDTAGAGLDAAILGYHARHGATMTCEVIQRHVDDRGGGLARIDGRLRLVEGLALPDERIESRLSFYNSATYWIDIDRMLAVFALDRGALENDESVRSAVRNVAGRVPTYITLKDVKKRWGKGQEDVFPVSQFEKLWGDMTMLPEVECRFVAVQRIRGQQLKEPAQLDAWLRDGSAAYVERLCGW